MKRKGKLVVIDGTDGVGKATQTKLLVNRLKREGVPVATLDFPQYYNNFFGDFIAANLTGKYGNFLNVDPYIASVMYAADRFESKPKIEKWLAEGKTVILDRYVSANQMHQGGKVKNAAHRRRFLTWLDTMEHEVFGLPRPDVIIYLHLPINIVLKWLKNKDRKKKGAYAKGKVDRVEANKAYLLNAQKSAEELIRSNSRWRKIDCSDGKGGFLGRDAIHEKIYAAIKKM